jgi:hypothetical protein
VNQQARQADGGLTMPEAGKRSRRYEMKGFAGVTDNDWFAFLSQQLGINEVR